METVLGNTGKVFVDTKGNGNVLYLPLDKLLDRKAADGQKPPVTLPDVTVTPNASQKESVDAAADARTRARGNR